MSSHDLWYIRRDGEVIGPFPEALVCRYIVLGRIGQEDELSQDGHFWRKLDELPQLAEKVQALIGLGESALLDPQWREERIKASLRWLDERASPDRRSQESPEASAAWAAQRRGGDRRALRHTYRQAHAALETWLYEQHKRHGKRLMILILVLLVAIVAATIYRPVNPIKIGLFIPSLDCKLSAAAKVNWAGCNKSGILLVGSDLSGASLSHIDFTGANLAYSNFSEAWLDSADMKNADLTHTNLRGAQLQNADLRGANMEGADLTDASFDNAHWTDGRICKPASTGRCL